MIFAVQTVVDVFGEVGDDFRLGQAELWRPLGRQRGDVLGLQSVVAGLLEYPN